ncbi:MAG: hypothetical protein LAT67_15285 [Balneolales bacterium]|nr:hypothetical protein [Balneolales bacterium]
MWNIFRNKRTEKNAAPAKPLLPNSVKIADRERKLFDRAIQLYIFVHHMPHEELEPELADQLRFTGNAVYSLILNWLLDGKPSLEYMEFLNEKVAELNTLPQGMKKKLQIQPNEVDQLELSREVKIRFKDDEGRVLHICYEPESGVCRHDGVET